ncbi:hypothetical protein ATN83_p10205 (plasmid) [Raoultella ornithinolytica]|nr:hypothetical protein ATN83_p10205 [Raoultella ornithinolytica]
MFRLQSYHSGELTRLMRPVGRAVVRQPFNEGGRQVAAEASFHRTQYTSCTVSLSYPPLLAAQCSASRSQQSSANVTRSFSLLSQTNSKPSEHLSISLSANVILALCLHFGRSGLSCNNNRLCSIITL